MSKSATTTPGGELGAQLFHVLLSISKIKEELNSELQQLRICGTYTSLKSASTAAYSCLFDAGFDRDWFDKYETIHANDLSWSRDDGVVIYAVAPGGEVFTVSIATTGNPLRLVSNNESHKIDYDLYHVLVTTIHYDKDASGGVRETRLQGSYRTYEDARLAAGAVKLDEDTGGGKAGKEWAEYRELNAGDESWEFGENIVVHAIGMDGENILTGVVKSRELDSVRVADAAMRMR